MRLLCLFFFVVLLNSCSSRLLAKGAAEPSIFISNQDGKLIQTGIQKYPMLAQAYAEALQTANDALAETMDVPVPKDPAGGYTHDKHKGNYAAMYNAGLMYTITNDKKYADYIIRMLLKYADLVPSLKLHPEARGSSPGRLFHQALNDANWLVYSAIAYDCVRGVATAEQRDKIDNGAFRPMCKFITVDLKKWFNLVHNHGVWACAAVGMTGLVIGDEDMVQESLYGTNKDGKSGFIAQLDHLFSPDGYYTEGPYYARYAMLPFYLYAQSLQNKRPALKIFEHRDQILKKALYAALQQTNSNGAFFPINDAIKDKTYISSEVIVAVDIAYAVYGQDKALLSVAAKQEKVLLNKEGISVARALSEIKNVAPFPYASVEYLDGGDGKEGGITLLRNGKPEDQTTLVLKYASHGLSHGHYDALNILLFDKGNEILQDYGAARFLNVEQKDGGRYLLENKKYAQQTVAHNTIVVDEKSQFDGKEAEAEKHHAQKLFSDFSNPLVKAVAAKEENAYSGVKLQRGLYLLQLPLGKKVVIDIFNASSPTVHQYDLPFQYNGQFINTSANLKANSMLQKPLGKNNGYQFLWNEAEAKVADTIVQFTFLNTQSYYSVSTLVQDSANVVFTRIGANDPNFNLRREPAFIIRKKGTNQSFISVLEIHGNFDPVSEVSFASSPSVKEIKMLENNDDYTIAKVVLADKEILVAQCNKDFNSAASHNYNNKGVQVKWMGPYIVLMNGKPLQQN